MDKINKYKKILKRVLDKHSKVNFENMPNLKSEVIVDTVKNHYILMDMGWTNLGFIHKWVFHFELKGDKIHLHKNMTDFNIVEELVENGINKDDFVFTMLNEPKDVHKAQLGEAA